MSATTISDLIERAYAQARPITAQLELTYKCNLLCSFCYNAPQQRRELDGDQWIRAIRKVKAAGTFNVTLTGGEPFCHRDFFRIAQAVRDEGLVLKVYTNGVLLADREKAERYAALGPFDTEVSLHGADAATHERLTGIRGSFDKLMVALGHLSDLGLKVSLKTPITRLNQHQLHDVDAIGERFGYRVTYDTNVLPTDDGDVGTFSLQADKEFLISFFVAKARAGEQGFAPRPVESMPQNCGTGRTGITIDPYGEMFPCVAWRRSLGNIEEVEDIGALWRGEVPNENLAYVRQVADETPRRTLAPRPEGGFASFCPGVAERETGDAYAFYAGAKISGLAKLEVFRRAQQPQGNTAESQD